MRRGIQDERYRRLLDILVAARRSAGLSQTDVAVRLDKPQQFVSRYELGERRLDVFEYVDVAMAIGLEPITVIKKLLSQ